LPRYDQEGSSSSSGVIILKWFKLFSIFHSCLFRSRDEITEVIIQIDKLHGLGAASGNHFHFIFIHLFTHHLTWDQPRPHTSSVIFSLGLPTSVLSGRGRGSRQRLSPTLHTGQCVRRGFLILVLSGLCRGRNTDLHSLLGPLVRVSRGDFLTLVRSESSRGRHKFVL
jgi:hypothetical protein